MYLDLVITLNVAINFLLLKLAGQVARQKTTIVRLFAGSALGGAVLLFLLLPAGDVLIMSWPGKILLSVAMIAVTYRPRRWNDVFLLLLLFYLCSFALAGLVFSFLLLNNYSVDFSHNIFFFHPPSLIQLLFAGMFLLAFVYWISPLLGDKFKIANPTSNFEVEVVFFGKRKKLSAFMDTGNMLKDPFSGRPVAVASFPAVAELLPYEIRTVLGNDSGLRWDELEKALLSCGAVSRFRLIPYHSINQQDYLVAFRPDKIRIWQEGREVTSEKGLIIAIAQQHFKSGGEYELLLPLEVYRSPQGEGR